MFEDVTGNLFISNPLAPNSDPRMETETFTRDSAQNKMIGLFAEENNTESIIKPLGSFNDSSVNDLDNEIIQFNGPCPNCQTNCETNMKLTGSLFL